MEIIGSDGVGAPRLRADDSVARQVSQRDPRRNAGHPPVNYIAVESVDEYAKKAKRLGATEVMPKTAVKEMGWFVWLKDTEGNVFALWETDGEAA